MHAWDAWLRMHAYSQFLMVSFFWHLLIVDQEVPTKAGANKVAVLWSGAGAPAPRAQPRAPFPGMIFF
jgi:hypothetical protein